MRKIAEDIPTLDLYHLTMGISQKFTEHPNSVDETYVEHMRVAAGFSRQLLRAAWCCAVHAVFPWRHCSTGSSAVKELHAQMTAGARGTLADAA